MDKWEKKMDLQGMRDIADNMSHSVSLLEEYYRQKKAELIRIHKLAKKVKNVPMGKDSNTDKST